MDSVKVENFRRANPATEFPRFTPLASAECTQLRAAIAKRVGLDAQAGPRALIDTLWTTAEFIADINAVDKFELRELIFSRHLRAQADVLVSWQRFDNIDRLALSDLSEHFDDIWYPISDDIEIFDENLEWFVFVRHDGCVKVLDLSLSRIRQ